MLQISHTTMQLLEAVFTLPEDVEDSCAVDRCHHGHVFANYRSEGNVLGLKTEVEDGSSSFR